ncbi:type VI-A CRISPR-associated RNA-guided ribonuclease Cas13a [Limnohabitans sp.]|uniref:type VI-A CRISPR-associated RNA-guided ribonuclease Cas13a n=1 Tax=Limnohabitans sp. TaxID=1907725 RepID=UPI0031FE25FD
MLVIKPYGRTQTKKIHDAAPTKQRQRMWIPSTPPADAKALEKLSNETDFLVAQWISVIDKIIKKPNPKSPGTDGKPTQLHYQARQHIGHAALKHLPPVDATTWQWKLHPYATTNLPAHPDKLNIQGRLYKAFVGDDIKPEKIDAALGQQIAEKIHAHLINNALNALGTTPKNKGRIGHQLQSIANNVHSPRNLDDWPNEDAAWDHYFTPGDVVATIAKALEGKHSKPPKTLAQKKWGGPLQSPPAATQPQIREPKLNDKAIIAKHLFDHFGRVFGTATKVKDLLESSHPQNGLWRVHERIKATYKALFDNASIEGLKNLHKRLPSNKDSMRKLIGQRKNNHDVSHLVRLGKVIHYQAAAEGKTVRAAWPDLSQRIEESAYWLSDGQAEIKRSEALVRVFKDAISHAGRTFNELTQLKEGDIFLKAKKAAENISADTFSERLAMLFGKSQKDFFPSSWGTDGKLSKSLKALLEQSIEAWAQLRHSSFHFKGRDGFLQTLRAPLQDLHGSTNYPDLDAMATQIWASDVQTRQERIRQTLVAVHCEQHLSQKQLQEVFEAVSGKELLRQSSELELPRLNRVLTRAQNTALTVTAGDQPISLPQPAKREALERNPSLRCQYVLIKLLYEQSFTPWLLNKSFHEINKWITHAIDQSQKSARELNGKGVRPKETIQARANGLWQSVSRELANQFLQGQNPIAFFFEQLAAATATEFRVQRHYEPNAEAARKQAAFIDNLKCDVVAMAFAKYLYSQFPWLLNALPGTAQSAVHGLSPSTTAADAASSEGQAWQQRLYFLMHFVPVDVASHLLHQLRKWHILSIQEKDSVRGEPLLYDQCAQVLTLYLDMHDAKFDGGVAYRLSENERNQLQSFFERAEDFEMHFPPAQGTQADSQIDSRTPLRSLRELMRFGALGRLSPLFKNHPITHSECERFKQLQKEIGAAQNERETLHGQWVESREDRNRTFQNTQRYGEVLKKYQEHRHLAHRVRLLDNVKLHNLLMAVLARLADYAGLWERDLYFVTLAFCHQQQLDLPALFTADGDHGNFFDNGQIVEALRKVKPNPLPMIETLFGQTYLKGELVDIRNRFSHFNMLQGSTPALDLTQEVNHARKLMAYDRKLKNAVSKSIIEMLAREGLKITWKTNADHRLFMDKVESEQITHLGDKDLKEILNGQQYCQMINSLFAPAHAPEH